MKTSEDEEELLRLVALKNANSVLLARRQVEAALAQKSEELAHMVSMMRATLESTTDGILVTDDRGTVTDFNSRFVETWRLPPEIVQSREYQKWLDFIAPQLADPGEFLSTVREIVTLSPSASLHVLKCADGRVLERHSKVQRIGKRIVGRVWSLRDITDRSRAEEDLKQQREWFRVTLSSIGDAVITTDTEARVTFLNPIAEAMTGWPVDEARGQPLEKIFNIINEQSRQPVAHPVSRVLRDGVVVGLANHTALIAKNGKETAIEDSAAPIKDAEGIITGAVMVFHDVTERRKSENSLRRSEKMLSDFFDSAAVGLHWFAPDGRILRANLTELKMLGYSKEEYIGHHIAEFHVNPATAEDMLRQLTRGESLEDFEVHLRCKDGSIKDVLLSSNVLWKNGKIVHTRCFTRDITEQKRAQAARAHLAALVESSDDAILSKTLDGRILTWNKGAAQMFGYTAEEVVGKSVTLLMPPDRTKEEDRILGRLRRGEHLENYETVRRRKDGTLFDVALTVSPIYDAKGTIVGASKIARNITGRKQTEATLRASEASFRQLADAMPQMVWAAHPEGQVDYYNRRWYDYTGATEGAGGDESWVRFLHPDDALRCHNLWRDSVKAGRAYQVEHRLKNRAGEYRWHLGRALPIRNEANAIVRWYGSYTDIHEQKLTADALREEYAIVEHLNTVAQTLATELDLGNIVRVIASAGARIIRAHLGSFISKHLGADGPADISYMTRGASQPDLEKFPLPHNRELLNATLSGEGVIRLDDVRKDPRFDEHTPHPGRSEGLFPIASYLAVPVIARSGEVLGGLFFGHANPGIFKERDEKIVVALAAQAAAAMETARLYKAEQQARNIAEQANQTKDDFLAALSHELRTPLTPVLAILSSMGEDVAIPPALAADLETVRRNVELETRLIDDLLDITRITRDKLELHCERVRIDQVIENAINTCLSELKAKQLTLVRDLQTSQHSINADRARITQILWNLLKNSIKFTPPGGTITIHSRIASTDGTTRAAIEVQDTGIGMEPHQLLRIFNAFEQGSRNITRQFGGLGLGLAISKAITDCHGGTISAASDGPGRGSTFTLILPCEMNEEVPGTVTPADPNRLQATKPRPLRILLVEDHDNSAAIISRLLRRSGHTVAHAATVSEALRIAEDEMRSAGLDLVISDLGLPDGSGLDMMRKLSADFGLQGIALSGFGMDSDREESSAAGFARHLTKPVDIADLRNTINEMSQSL